MATLQNIRNRGVLIAIVVGVALLAFVIGDFLNSGSSIFHESKQTVAEFDGEKIKINEFQEAVDQLHNVYKIEFGRSDFDENEMSQIRNQVWENMITERIIEAEAAKIGLTVSKEELKERLFGNNIHPLIMQRGVFVDPQTGQFSKAALLQFYNTVFGSDLSPQDQEQVREAKSYWMFWEKNIKNSILQDKYLTLLSKTVGANAEEVKYNYEARKMGGHVNYVFQPYAALADSAVTVSDTEIKALYEKRKDFFKQDPNRTIQYVSFEVGPSEADFAEGEEWIARVEEEFVNTDDVIGLVNDESDISYNGTPYTSETVPSKLKDFAFSNSSGAIYGPVFENNTYTMARIVESGIYESDSVKLRLIYIPEQNDTKGDSIINAIRGGAKFTDMVAKYNPEAASEGGEVDWVTRQVLNKEIADPAFSKGTNELFKISNMNGTQVFQVMERTPARQKVKLAILERKIIPGNQTYSDIFNEAKQFAAGSTDAKKFEELAQERGYVVRPAQGLNRNSENVNMIPQSRQVVRWAFENKKGAVSDVFDCDRNIYVVATVSEINDKEHADISLVTPQLKAELMKDKKAEVLKKQLSELIASNNSLEGLAEAIGAEVRTAENVNFSSFQFGDAGAEPKVIGMASVTEAGKLSSPIQGEAGVYVIQPDVKTADETPFNLKLEQQQLDMRLAQTLPYAVMQKLREKYNVVDNRANFY